MMDTGIFARNDTGGELRPTNLTISSASVIGARGILAENRGTGALSITTTGTTTGVNNEGIRALNYGSDLTILATSVSGGSNGIDAQNISMSSRTGAISITATGTVTGASSAGAGVTASNRGGTALTINVATVSSTYYGIYADHNGSGALSITATGSVTASDEGSYGIKANAFSGTSVTINTAAVSGGSYGIYAYNEGSGALSITATGTVTARDEGGYGIKATNDNTATSLTINSAEVSGGFYGIYAYNEGTGALSITATGTVTAREARGTGIYATNDRAATDLTIVAAAVSGGFYGIYAYNEGTGALSITATGTVTAREARGTGIYARTRASTTNLTITTAAVTGSEGIVADHRGSGALTITANGTVTGTIGEGIVARNGRARRIVSMDVETPPTNLTIVSADVTGATNGVYALNNGSGALSITSTGTVTGTSEVGIFATNGTPPRGYDITGGYSGIGYSTNAGTDLTVSAATVTGGKDGIVAFNNGSGALTITSTGTVTGTSGRGIYAANGGAARAITDPGYDGGYTGGYDGDRSASTKALEASVADSAFNNTGTNLTISTASVAGGTEGIVARNFGSGAISITTTGTVTGTSGRGIYATNGGMLAAAPPTDISRSAAASGINYSGTNLTIVAAAASGGTDAIDARNYGSGALSVTASGAVTGGSGAGISTRSLAGGPVAITLLPTASVSATSGAAIVDMDGDAVVTINGGAVVTGSVALGDGNDRLTFRSGASLAGVTTLDGGSGDFVDTLDLSSQFTGDINSWEIVNATNSSGSFMLNGIISGADQFNKLGAGTVVLTGDNTLTGVTRVSAGTLRINGSQPNSPVIVQSGGTLGGTGTIGSLTAEQGSTVAPGNSIGTLAVTGDLTLAAGSTLAIEISPTSTDLITATGAAMIAGNLAVTPQAGTYFGRTYTLVTANSVTGTFASSTFGSPLGTAFRATLLYSPTSVMLRLDPNSLLLISGGSLKGNPLAVATAIDAAVDNGYNPQPFISLYGQGPNLSGALSQLSGELHSAERRVGLQDSRIVRETAFDRLNAGSAATPGTSSVTSEAGETSKTIWMRVAGSWGTARTDGIGSRYTTNQAGILVGFDLGKGGFKLGGMLSYLNTNIDLQTLGRSKVESIGGAVYAGYREEGSGFAVGFGAALASNKARGSRTISIPGLNQTLNSNINGLTYQFFAEGAYDLAKADNIRAEPFARIAYARLDSKAFAETGGIAALRGATQDYELTTATLGFRGGIVSGKTTLSGSAGWQRTGGDRAAPTLLTMSGVNTPYIVRSAALDRDAVALEAQASVSVSSSFTLGLGYSGVLGKRNSDHGARATARVTF